MRSHSLSSDWSEWDDSWGEEAGPPERTGQSGERGGQASSDGAERRTADPEVRGLNNTRLVNTRLTRGHLLKGEKAPKCQYCRTSLFLVFRETFFLSWQTLKDLFCEMEPEKLYYVVNIMLNLCQCNQHWCKHSSLVTFPLQSQKVKCVV